MSERADLWPERVYSRSERTVLKSEMPEKPKGGRGGGERDAQTNRQKVP